MCGIKFSENRTRSLNFMTNVNFLIFFIVTSNFKNSIYSRSFLCEEAKIKQHTSSKKKLCEVDEKAIWESGFKFFFFYIKIHNFFKLILFLHCVAWYLISKNIKDWIASKDNHFFHHIIHLLPKRWQKVINSVGRYFD